MVLEKSPIIGQERPINRQKEIFTHHLRVIKTILDQYEISYSLVGGMAVRAILGQEVEYRRSNGTIPDVDIIGLGPDAKTIKEAHQFIKVACNDSTFPEIGLEPAIFGKRGKYPVLEVLSGLRIDQGRFHLTYRDIEQEIPAETMMIKERSYGGIFLPCLPPKTIYWRYLTRGGLEKEKDHGKLKALRSYIENHPEEELSDEYYQPYLEFIKEINEKYPLIIKFHAAYWHLDHLLGERISGSKGFLYGLIKFFRET